MRLSRISLALGLVAANAASARAQNLVLVHGFAASPATWYNPEGNTVDYLQARYPNHAIETPGYPWYASLAITATALTVNDPANSILIGHSEGGALSRRYAESHYLSGIVTMGTPNYGANMATNYPMFLNHLNHTMNGAWRVSGNLWALDPPWWMNIIDRFYYSIDVAIGALQWIPSLLDNAVGFIPIVTDFSPYSDAMANLNGDGGLPLELAHVPAQGRASLYYEENTYYYAPAWRVALGNQDGWELANTLTVLEQYTWQVHDEATNEELNYDWFYEDNDDRFWALVDLEWDTLDMAVDIDTLDFEWCADISMRLWDYWNAPDMWCHPNDLFIATEGMVAPGATPFLGTPVMHTAETRQGFDIQRVLQEQFNIFPPY